MRLDCRVAAPRRVEHDEEIYLYVIRLTAYYFSSCLTTMSKLHPLHTDSTKHTVSPKENKKHLTPTLKKVVELVDA